MTTITERRGLGRGLGELFQRTDLEPQRRERESRPQARGRPDRSAPVPIPEGSYFAELPAETISANPRQPRTVFDEEAMQELVESIQEVGLLQPVVVRPLGSDRFELVMGERRWRAAQVAGLAIIPAIVRETKDHDLLRDALLENLHRAQLNPLEEAAAYSQLLEDFGCTQDELSSRIKRSRPQISNTMRLLRLPRNSSAPSGRRGVERRSRPRPTRGGRSSPAGAAGPADRGRRSVRAVDRGTGCDWGREWQRTEAASIRAYGRRATGGGGGYPIVGRPRHPGAGRPRAGSWPDHHRVRQCG